jgi:hypothetical protein
MRRTLVVARELHDAPDAARWASGDAVVHIGAPRDHPASNAASAEFDDAVISGDLRDSAWLSAAFELAGRCLGAGGRVALLLPETGAIATLPAPVVDHWRLVGVAIEHPGTAISFARAAELDGVATSADDVRRAQLVGAMYRRPDAAAAIIAALTLDGAELTDSAGSADLAGSVDEDEELTRVRRELAAYRNSSLGRLTNRYWALRGRLRRWLRPR